MAGRLAFLPPFLDYSMTKLIALVVIAAGIVAADAAEIPEGATFEAPPEVAETLLTAGQAKLAEASLTDASKPTRAPKPTRVRLLIDCELGKANDVVELSAAEAKEAEAGGYGDSDKAAVAYALSLKSAE
jgi:hypothetical protein